MSFVIFPFSPFLCLRQVDIRECLAVNGTGVHRDALCRLIVRFGDACAAFMDQRMTRRQLTHLQFDEQWTYVAKKQARLTTLERETTAEIGDMYL
jgi:hypothetical protein